MWRGHWHQTPKNRTPHRLVEHTASNYYSNQINLKLEDNSETNSFNSLMSCTYTLKKCTFQLLKKKRVMNWGSSWRAFCCCRAYCGKLRRWRRVEWVIRRRILIEKRSKIHITSTMEPFVSIKGSNLGADPANHKILEDWSHFRDLSTAIELCDLLSPFPSLKLGEKGVCWGGSQIWFSWFLQLVNVNMNSFTQVWDVN